MTKHRGGDEEGRHQGCPHDPTSDNWGHCRRLTIGIRLEAGITWRQVQETRGSIYLLRTTNPEATFIWKLPRTEWSIAAGVIIVWSQFVFHDRIVRFQPLFLKLILNISVEYFRSPRILFKNCTCLGQNNTESGQKTFAFTKKWKLKRNFLQKQILASLQWPWYVSVYSFIGSCISAYICTSLLIYQIWRYTRNV